MKNKKAKKISRDKLIEIERMFLNSLKVEEWLMFSFEVFWSNKRECYLARSPQFPRNVVHGATIKEVFNEWAEKFFVRSGSNPQNASKAKRLKPRLGVKITPKQKIEAGFTQPARKTK